jgi:hypothetical protein
MVCGGVMTMPGLRKEPSAAKIDLPEDGRVVGLFWIREYARKRYAVERTFFRQ